MNLVMGTQRNYVSCNDFSEIGSEYYGFYVVQTGFLGLGDCYLLFVLKPNLNSIPHTTTENPKQGKKLMDANFAYNLNIMDLVNLEVTLLKLAIALSFFWFYW